MPRSPALAIAALTVSLHTSSAQAATDDPTLEQRDLIQEHMSTAMVLPATALWRFNPVKPYLGSEKLVCGHVNYQSAMRKYVGFRRFYALIDGKTVTLAQIENTEEDPSGRLRGKLDLLCGPD